MNLAKELQQLQVASDAFSLELRSGSWFELMHWHPDIHGIGNTNANARSVCLSVSRQYFEKVLAELSAWGRPSQCWFIADENDSGEDAIYVHTPNPNRENFPYRFDEVTWKVIPPSWLVLHFPETLFVHGQSQFDGGVLHWVVPGNSPATINAGLF